MTSNSVSVGNDLLQLSRVLFDLSYQLDQFKPVLGMRSAAREDLTKDRNLITAGEEHIGTIKILKYLSLKGFTAVTKDSFIFAR